MKNLAYSVLACCILLIANLATAQYDLSKINKKAIEAYNKGLERAQDGYYPGAITFLQQAISLDPKYVDAYLSLAGVYGQMKDHKQSVATYEKAFDVDPKYTSEYRLPYSINLAGLGEFQKAQTVIQNLLSQQNLNPNTRKAAEHRLKTYQFAIDFEKNNPDKNYVFKPVNLGEGVNTKHSEYFPTIPILGEELVFTRRTTSEDFFYSQNKSNKWDVAKPLPGNINTPLNEGAQTISQDGTWLIFTGCRWPQGFGGCDLYISYLTREGWSEAVNLGNQINTESWESQPSLSPDKRQLYFASDRPGGYGGSDLYVSNLQPNGTWSKPVNLGPEINTSGEENSPFIHADNQTLFFASNKLPGYGEEDLFIARKDSDGKWGQPQNLGYPINTINNEATIFIAADGRTAYYASDRSEGRGGLDIYSFELREGIRPYKTLAVKGKVFDKKTNEGLPSGVELIDLSTKQIISRVQTDEKGNYLITLPVGKDYAFNVNRKGYLFYSDNFQMRGKSPDSTYTKNIPLQPIEVNAAVVLKNIFFDFNKFELKPESQVELDRVVQLLNENPTVKILIAGYTDNIGTSADNVKLSENRAKSVINYLVSKGINSKRLSSKGFGALDPIADNSTEEGRALNRRTELKIISK